MFFGSFKHSLDDKGRLVLPSKFRFAFVDKIYLLKGYEGSLRLYNEKDFEEYLKHISSFPIEKKSSRDIVRIALSSVRELTIDSQYRILFPKEILEQYGIKKEVVIVGLLNHIEVWDNEKWNEYKMKNEEEFELNTEKFYDER